MPARPLLRRLFIPVLLVFCVSASVSARAQDNGQGTEPVPTPGNSEPQGPNGGKHAGNPDKMKERRLAQLDRTVQLTADQKTKVTPIISNFVDGLMALKNDGALAPEERKAKQKELRKEYAKQLRSILTPDQKKAWKEAEAARRSERGQGQKGGENPEHSMNQPQGGTPYDDQ